MTIHDELVLKLIEPDKSGKATGYITELLVLKTSDMHWKKLIGTKVIMKK